MQGFILSMRTIRNQDLIVRILSPSCVFDAYRFYGVRHSILSVAKKIDFDLQKDGLFLPKLRNIIELGHSWEKEYARMYVWQFFVQLLCSHLRDVGDVEPFYFQLLESGASKMKRQNPMRVALEMSAGLFGYEGRVAQLHHNRCFICEEELGDEIALGRAFLFAHPYCVGGDCFSKHKILNFLTRSSTIELDEFEIEKLWKIFSLGL